jgi:hypothetical protein
MHDLYNFVIVNFTFPLSLFPSRRTKYGESVYFALRICVWELRLIQNLVDITLQCIPMYILCMFFLSSLFTASFKAWLDN